MATPTIEAIYPLSPAQEGMLFHLLLARSKHGRTDAFHEQYSCRLRGELDSGALREAWRLVFARHSALRSVFVWERREKPVQVALAQVELPFVEEDWRGRVDGQAALERLQREDIEEPFDLTRSPIARLRLIRLEDHLHFFQWTFSHLLLDGWSIGLVLGEVFEAYFALTRGMAPDLAPARPFKTFIDWVQSRSLAEAETFWRRELQDFEGPTSLAIDAGGGRARGEASSRLDRAGRVIRLLPEERFEELKKVCGRLGLTLNSFVQSAWSLLLAGLSGSNDVVYGGVVSGRPPSIEGIEKVVGMFINGLPIRARLQGDLPFSTWALEQQIKLVALRDFEFCPLEKIGRWIGQPHDLPLFECLVAFENYPRPEGRSDLEIESVLLREVSNYPFLLYVTASSTLITKVVFDLDRFAVADIEMVLEKLLALIERLVAEPTLRISEACRPRGVEEREILTALAGPARQDLLDAAAIPVHRQIAEIAARRPEALAVTQIGHSSGLTYGELVRRSRDCARHLAALGTGPGDLVAIALERSPATLVALLGVLEAGAAFLPIDPKYPAERIQHMLEDSGASLLLVGGSPNGSPIAFSSQLPRVELTREGELIGDRLEGEEGQGWPVSPADLAYVIYTSGSTGKSKGVAISHRSIAHYSLDAAEVYGIRPDDRVLQFASFSFDTSLEEIFPTLLRGATLVLRDEEMIASPATFLAAIEEASISVLDLPTAYWHELCSGLGPSSALFLPARLHTVILGGEAALAEPLARWQAHVAREQKSITLWNSYGPTETTIVATRFDLSSFNPGERRGEIPIGRPIANTRAYVLDAAGRLLPPGQPGELAIAGPGVASHYLRRPELSAEKFRADSFSGTPGERYYRSGDQVVATTDGLLLFRGRIDQQVKIRGFRVEPGEIESALLGSGRLREAAVVALPDPAGGLYLVAYVVAADPARPPQPAELRAGLLARLPEHQVPSAFVSLPALPKTPSGKLDRRALPAPDLDAGVLGTFVPPRTPMEELVAEVWQELLGRERVGVHEDFFQLGGHSLLVGRVTTRLRQILQVEIPLITLFEFPTIETLARRLEDLAAGRAAGTGVSLPPIVRLPRDGSPLPLSYPQERVWFLQQLELSGVAYNFQTTIFFEGALDVPVLEACLTEIVRRHEIFWTRFPEIEGRPVMVLEAPWPVALPIEDLRHLPEDERAAAADALIRRETAQAFDVTELPLVRWRLVRTRDDFHMLIQVEHHFVHDGWSFGVLLGEIKTLYEAFSAGAPSPLPELEVQYADFAAWQRKYISGEVVGGLVDFWKKKLDGMPQVLDLPTDHPRPKGPSTRGDAEFFVLPDELYSGLRELARRQGVTLYMAMLATFYALLYRYTGQGDLGIGAGVANRRQKVQEALIGMTVNTIVLRATFDGNTTFAELMKRTRASALEAYAHQDMPFEQLVAALQPERHVSRNPLVQVLFSFHDAATPKLDFGGMKVSYLVRTNRSAKTDLNVIVAPKAEQQVGVKSAVPLAEERPQQAAVIWEYNRELFEPATIRRMVGHYLTLCADALQHPEKKISELLMMDPAELARVSGRLLAPVGRPEGPALPTLFAAAARRNPEAIAIAGGGTELTYAELDLRSSRLAAILQRRGVRPGELVGLAARRSPELVISMLGIVKAGAAYLPLDPSYPAERLALMLEDAATPLLVAHQGLAAGLPKHVPRLLLDDGELESPGVETTFEPPPIDDSFPAYVIYTSGSTGRPKGVLVPQRAVARLVLGTNYLQIGPDDRVMQASSASFDAATFDVWAPLLNGGRVVLVDQDTLLSPPELATTIEREGINTAFLTTALFNQLVEACPGVLARFRGLLFGGERCDPRRVAQAYAGGARGLVHVYGPTECTTFATFHPVNEAPGEMVPIGLPIAGTETRIFDRDGRICAPGVPGELCLGGEGLADGYLGRPALTAEKFVPHPAPRFPGQRLYRTGDLVRLSGAENSETLEFLGRLDHQIKLRGFRIEPGEIEAALAAHPEVSAAIVLLREDHPGDRRLVAYAAVKDAPEGGAGAAELLEYLRRHLPEFMVPSACVVLPQLPLNANGKIDRRALPAPEWRLEPAARVAPTTPTEAGLAEIWSEILNLPAISVEEDFFSLGGHSLLATQMISRITTRFSLRLGLAQIFENPTVRTLARQIDAEPPSGSAKIDTSAIPSKCEAALLEQAADLDDDNLDALLRSMAES